eukprot:1007972-Pleurochrysis_carterae.AAC.1
MGGEEKARDNSAQMLGAIVGAKAWAERRGGGACLSAEFGLQAVVLEQRLAVLPVRGLRHHRAELRCRTRD